MITANQLLQEALSLQTEIVENRRSLHKIAETGFSLDKTLAFVKKKLENFGCSPTPCGKAGLTVLIEGRKEKKETFLLRADMDALPIPEEANLPFAADNGNMHACGHDMHTAMLLGAAKLLKAHENELCGKVKLMFQPAEELLEGAKDMIENGVLKKPNVSAALAMHVITAPNLSSGSVVVASQGVSAPAADFFTIKIQGKGCHGSMPHEGIDALTAASHVVVALQEFSARETSIAEKGVLTIGKMQAGKTSNAIADTAVLEGTLRAFSEELRERMKKRLAEISEYICAAFRAKAEISFTSGCPTLVNDGALSEFAQHHTKELLGEEKVFTTEEFAKQGAYGGGSEDFAYVAQETPSVFLSLACGKGKPLHHPEVEFDESPLYIGSAISAYIAIKWLENR